MKQYDVAAYIWPAYTGDEPRSRTFWPEGYGEWQTVRQAQAKFEGHAWPRKPLWGYQNEADPYVMQMQIDAAADHGVNVFIYDWYWYDRRPFLEQCLNNGYLKARNNDRVKFYLMWANHSVNDTWDIRNSHHNDNIIWDGAVTRDDFETIARRMIEKYFRHPSYYTIDGKPVLMIYDLQNLLRGLGGAERTRAALSWFRDECVKSGLPGLHVQLTKWGKHTYNLSGVDGERAATTAEAVAAVGFDSLTHYQFVHFTNVERTYADILPDVLAEWEANSQQFSVPYFPHVSVGWDSNPRWKALRPLILRENTPDQIEKAFRFAKDYVDRHPGQPPLITVNSWNEWTESSYLLPDDRFGYGYLEAVRKVFLGR